MKNPLKRIALFCGIALITLAAFPVFAQDKTEINRKPLNDFTDLVINRLQTNQLVLSDNFLVEVEGELDKSGKFDLQKTKYIRAEGNENIVNVAKSAVEAVNDTGILSYLSQIGASKINIVFAQDNDQIYGVIKSDFATQSKARIANNALNLILNAAAMQLKGEDGKILLKASVISTEDKTVTIKTAVEKSVGQEMIQRKLTEELNKRLEQEKAK